MDLIVRNACIVQDGVPRVVDIGIQDRRIAVVAADLVADAPEMEAGGCLVVPGMIETHIHLDKTCIMDRCRIEEGTVAEAVRITAAAKKQFTVEDVYARGKNTLERCIGHGTHAHAHPCRTRSRHRHDRL